METQIKERQKNKNSIFIKFSQPSSNKGEFPDIKCNLLLGELTKQLFFKNQLNRACETRNLSLNPQGSRYLLRTRALLEFKYSSSFHSKAKVICIFPLSKLTDSSRKVLQSRGGCLITTFFRSFCHNLVQGDLQDSSSRLSASMLSKYLIMKLPVLRCAFVFGKTKVLG